MKFWITRTSVWAGDPGVEEAQPGRIEDEEGWFVEVESLEDLVTLNQRYGNLILSTHGVVPAIEIYDDYRE